MGLADKVNTVVGALSGGMKRKLSLAIALIGNSKVEKGSMDTAVIFMHAHSEIVSHCCFTGYSP